MFANFQSANPNKDFELPDVQEDGLSKMKFSPNANYLAACSWDNSVSVLCACVRASCRMRLLTTMSRRHSATSPP